MYRKNSVHKFSTLRDFRHSLEILEDSPPEWGWGGEGITRLRDFVSYIIMSESLVD